MAAKRRPEGDAGYDVVITHVTKDVLELDDLLDSHYHDEHETIVSRRAIEPDTRGRYRSQQVIHRDVLQIGNQHDPRRQARPRF